jgi:predicted Zn-dependent protease
MYKKIILLFLAAAIGYACATVAVTGRRQLSLVPNSELIPMADDQYRQVIAEAKLSTNATQTAMVKRVGERISKAVEEYLRANGGEADLKWYKWEFNLIEEDIVNAWCMPGGKVAFYTGILPVCKDEAGVAVVMGHEVAHAVAHHGRERMSTAVAANFGLSTLGAAMGQNPSLTKDIFLQSVGMGTQLGVLKFSRQHESEADKMGLIFMAMAGYDPNEAPKFWERMQAMSGGQSPPEFVSTHPSHDRRISDLEAAIPEAMKYYKK